MKIFLLLFSFSFSFLFTTDASLAETVNCTRYKIEGKSLYKNMTELNLALPETLEIPDREFIEKTGSKSMLVNPPEINSGFSTGFNKSVRYRKMTFLSNGKLIYPGPVKNTGARYECDKKPSEIKAIQAKRQNCRAGNIDECSNDDLCQFATNSKWSSADKARVIAWNEDARWANHLSAAKKLDLKCSVGELLE
jgi:hypothetical protein